MVINFDIRCFFAQVSQFEKLAPSDPEGLISISPLTGEVINNRILDFEQMREIVLQVRRYLNKKKKKKKNRSKVYIRLIDRLVYCDFKVRARAGDPGQERFSDARVVLKLQDVNDNSPLFEQQVNEEQS